MSDRAEDFDPRPNGSPFVARRSPVTAEDMSSDRGMSIAVASYCSSTRKKIRRYATTNEEKKTASTSSLRLTRKSR